MPKFQKRPLVVDAFQWKGNHMLLDTWVEGVIRDLAEDQKPSIRRMIKRSVSDNTQIFVETPNGQTVAQQGDWIIFEPEGYFYPCSRDVFERNYQAYQQPVERS